MQRLIIGLLFFMASCSEVLDQPKDLLSEEQMAVLLADFAINDQSFSINSKVSQEEATKYIMKNHKITGNRFVKSYEYYLTQEKKMNNIFEGAKEIILNKDPKAKVFINNKLKEIKQATDKQ